MRAETKYDIHWLWEDFLKGNDKAFARIYYIHIDSLLSYGRKLTRDEELLSDAVQEVFIDMYQKRQKLPASIDNPKAYLFAALRNNILKKLSLKHKFDLVNDYEKKADTYQVEYSSEDQYIINEIKEGISVKLQQAIIELSPRLKEIIYLKFEIGLGYAEISGVMGITAESARKHLYRALEALRQIMGNKQN